MESGEGVVQSREESDITAQPIDDVGNSTQDPGDGSNDHVDATANCDEEDSEDEEGIVAYLNTLHDMTIAKNEAPRANRIPSLKYGNTLFEHQKHAVGAAMRSLAGPLKGMILGDPQGFARP
ncbi:hypothetical protein FNYG_00821 [Fusarium nygamai]|uniref:Uncharacterized protein n=1 Tax=Gibberella nygamai TaxID=42673 RepID=A0A2K0WU00_GIBNY|nr:hypothetical protein FNYG_00821 [Fusarium nygamai]